MKELQATDFDPGTFLCENMIFHMNIYGRRLLRPERSSAARRCACLNIVLNNEDYSLLLLFLCQEQNIVGISISAYVFP